MPRSKRFTLEPLGDQGVLATFADEALAARFAEALRSDRPAWVEDVVLAYATVAVFLTVGQIGHDEACQQLKGVRLAKQQTIGRLHVIPCCYERQLDLAAVADLLHLAPEEVIQRHAACEYVVYAIGFCPGFPYLGYLPQELQGVPRLASPRVRVEPGSVGLTGKQTGIYPLVRPGGWHLIGQTPIELVNVEDEYFPIVAGDRIRFHRIDEAEFNRLRGERLATNPG